MTKVRNFIGGAVVYIMLCYGIASCIQGELMGHHPALLRPENGIVLVAMAIALVGGQWLGRLCVLCYRNVQARKVVRERSLRNRKSYFGV